MSTLKLIGLISALMLSAALVCSAGMLATSLFAGTMAPSPSDVLPFAGEAAGLLALTLWLGSRLRAGLARQR